MRCSSFHGHIAGLGRSIDEKSNLLVFLVSPNSQHVAEPRLR